MEGAATTRQAVSTWGLGGGGTGQGEGHGPSLQGMWRVAGRSGDSNEEDPSLLEHGRVREECAQGKQGPRRGRELVSG